eukprot:TRINITY_DN7128_c0_g1_i3.p1 TRINITY_DN7128_c0_g1~~TRINITY_DN7128_c0_g1_i3.p1  ORF type:complete len:340 (-),score=26.92 TRINITY_DN7128_c0_g1_i3:456-1322(-)
MIIGLKSGDTVMVSPVMGKGFPVDTVPASEYPDMLIFATGSGISPIKALIESGALDASSRTDVRVYYGATDADSMAYLDKIPGWEQTGLKVIKVFSARGEGYVQDVYAKDTPVAQPSKTCVLLCGQKEMAESVKEILGKQGVETFLTNFQISSSCHAADASDKESCFPVDLSSEFQPQVVQLCALEKRVGSRDTHSHPYTRHALRMYFRTCPDVLMSRLPGSMSGYGIALNANMVRRMLQGRQSRNVAHSKLSPTYQSIIQLRSIPYESQVMTSGGFIESTQCCLAAV